MSDIDILISRVVNYLRNIDAFSGSPALERTDTRFVCVDPRGEWDEYYMQPPFWQNREVEVHKNDFDSIESALERVCRYDIQTNAVRDIPDSKNTVIIELGSEFGERGAGYLAEQKSNAQVILVDKKIGVDRKFDYVFSNPHPDARMKRVVFKKGKHLLEDSDTERMINSIYHANGMKNLRFYQHELTLDEAEGNLPGFLRDVKGKNVYLIGYQSPVTLPFLMGKLYDSLDARAMSVSLTAQEKTKPDEFTCQIIQKNLGLTDQEIGGFIKAVHDPKATSVHGSLSEKYDYDVPAQKRVGVMIKTALALALAKEVDGTILRAEDNDMHFRNYNKEDHYVQAMR